MVGVTVGVNVWVAVAVAVGVLVGVGCNAGMTTNTPPSATTIIPTPTSSGINITLIHNGSRPLIVYLPETGAWKPAALLERAIKSKR